VRKTYDRLNALYYFPKMRDLVKRYVKCCKQCQMVAPKRLEERQPLQPIDIMHAHPFEDISIDVMGGDLSRTAKGNQCLVIILDNVSKWVHAIPVRNLCAGTIADKLMEFFCLFGIARTLRMDNSSGFRSQLMTKLRETGH